MPLRHARVPGHDARAEEVTPADPVIEHVAETGSTNSDLLARVTRRARPARALRAVPAGRRAPDRRARPPRPALARDDGRVAHLLARLAAARARDLSGLSLAVGVAIADALDAGDAVPRIGLKWPNDLWLVDDWSARRDAARPQARRHPGRDGALRRRPHRGCRHRPQRARAVGRRCLDRRRQPRRDRPGDATPASTLARVAPALVAALRRFDAAGFAPFAERFAARDLLRGLTVSAAAPTSTCPATAIGIASDGALLLRTAAGMRAVESGEWRLRVAERAGSTC